jgi:hypothetical protein
MVPGGKVAFAVHANTNGLKPADMTRESYLTDVAEEPDLSKHVTDVYQPPA